MKNMEDMTWDELERIITVDTIGFEAAGEDSEEEGEIPLREEDKKIGNR